MSLCKGKSPTRVKELRNSKAYDLNTAVEFRSPPSSASGICFELPAEADAVLLCILFQGLLNSPKQVLGACSRLGAP